MRTDYHYSTNSIENYYHEWRFPSGVPTMVTTLEGYLGHRTYSNKRYLFMPKASLSLTYHNRREEPAVQRNDTVIATYGFEFHRKHRLFQRKASFISELRFNTQYQDFRNKNQWDFYTEDSGLFLKERFRFSRNYAFEISSNIRAYQDKEDAYHGKIYGASVNNIWELGKSFGLELSTYFHHRMVDTSNETLNILGIGPKVVWKNVSRKTDLYFSYDFEWLNPNSNSEYTEGTFYQTELLLARRKGLFFQFEAFYRYRRQQASEDQGLRSFIQQSFGGGAKLYF